MNSDKNAFLTKTPVVIIGAFICCFLWGSAFPCIKIGYSLFDISSSDTYTQILFAGIRFILAGFLALLFGSFLSRTILIPKKTSITKIFNLSMLQTVAQYILFYIGLAHTTGVRSSIVEGTNVFVAIVVASLIFKQEDLTIKKMVGSTVGFAGVVLVSTFGAQFTTGNYLFGDLLVFLSTFAYAFSSVLLKRYSKEENPVILSGYQFIVGGIIMTIIGLICGGKLTNVTLNGIFMLLYLALVSAVAYSLWGILIKHNPISKVAVFGFINPVCGVILSAILLNEGSSLSIMSFVSLGLVCLGIYIVNKE
ncbi:MAG: EamA family transporter [Lachnospiraceae bacterium]|nr:EamA family transporter [Lachnospiraceae bacterium]